MKKIRISKDPKKELRQRQALKAGGEYKRALKARDGSQGPASAVRKIDPKLWRDTR